MTDVRIYLGMRGEGKTTRVRSDLADRTRVVVYDVNREQAYEDLDIIEGIPALVARLKENRAVDRIAYRWNADLEMDDDFLFACRALLATRGYTFVVEEADLFQNSQSLPKSLSAIVAIGRHRGLSLWTVSRTPTNIHPYIRSQAGMLVTFRQQEPNHLAWLESLTGRDFAARVRKLPRHTCAVWPDEAKPAQDSLDFLPAVE